MIRISFDIIGNHKDAAGNPMPKLKMTGAQSWTPRAREYVQWKNHVRNSLLRTLRVINPEAARRADQNIARFGKPLDSLDHDVRMDIAIAWKNGAHGDPENIFGSIADALFINDKNLWGSFSPLTTERGGRVRCIITVSDPSSDPLQAISEKRTWKHSSKNPASPRSKTIRRKQSTNRSKN